MLSILGFNANSQELLSKDAPRCQAWVLHSGLDVSQKVLIAGSVGKKNSSWTGQRFRHSRAKLWKIPRTRSRSPKSQVPFWSKSSLNAACSSHPSWRVSIPFVMCLSSGRTEACNSLFPSMKAQADVCWSRWTSLRLTVRHGANETTEFLKSKWTPGKDQNSMIYRVASRSLLNCLKTLLRHKVRPEFSSYYQYYEPTINVKSCLLPHSLEQQYTTL